MKSTLFSSALLFFVFVANCQTNIDTTSISKDSSVKKKSYFKIDFNYENNSVYLGRKDSAMLPYFSPTFTYNHKSGTYISASMGYLSSASEKRIDYYSLDAGYEFDINDRLSGSVYANKRFYNDSSNNISSDIGGSLSTSFSYDFDFVTLSAGFGASFANKTDYDCDFVLDRSFTLDKKERWSIAPKFTANFSTLHFYEGYTSRSFGKKAKGKNANILSVTSTTSVTKNKLTLMDFEIATPLSYEQKKWGFYFTPTVAIPQNPIYTTTTASIHLRNGNIQTITSDSTPDSEKNLKTSFYFELGAYIKF